MGLLRAWKAKSTGPFVIASSTAPRPGTSYTHYRANRHFETLRDWLREKGITSQKFLHELRKEYGSIVCQKDGLYASSRALRHADVQVTALHYLDKKDRISTGLGAVLVDAAPPPNVVPMTPASVAKSNITKAMRRKAR